MISYNNGKLIMGKGNPIVDETHKEIWYTIKVAFQINEENQLIQ